jgi:hypothetical protein
MKITGGFLTTMKSLQERVTETQRSHPKTKGDQIEISIHKLSVTPQYARRDDIL